MKVFSLLLCTFLIAGNLLSQKDSLLPANQIKISPLRIIDFVNPGYEISYERLHGKRYSTQLSLAYMTRTVWDIPFDNVRGYRIGLEEKYFLKTKNNNSFYLSADAVAYHVLFDKDELVYKQGMNDTIDFMEIHEQSSYRKNTFTLNVKYGVQTYMGNHFLLDVCFGLGVRYFQVVQTSFPDGTVIDPVAKNSFPAIYDHASEPWHYVTINIPFNIKFGYTF